MAITITVQCACGKSERYELHDDEEIPETCRECGGDEVASTQNQQQAEAPDIWNLTVVSKKRRKPTH